MNSLAHLHLVYAACISWPTTHLLPHLGWMILRSKCSGDKTSETTWTSKGTPLCHYGSKNVSSGRKTIKTGHLIKVGFLQIAYKTRILDMPEQQAHESKLTTVSLLSSIFHNRKCFHCRYFDRKSTGVSNNESIVHILFRRPTKPWQVIHFITYTCASPIVTTEEKDI